MQHVIFVTVRVEVETELPLSEVKAKLERKGQYSINSRKTIRLIGAECVEVQTREQRYPDPNH